MKRLLAGVLLAVGLAAPAAAGPFDELIIYTSTAARWTSGRISVAVSSASSRTATVYLDGTGGIWTNKPLQVDTSSVTFGSDLGVGGALRLTGAATVGGGLTVVSSATFQNAAFSVGTSTLAVTGGKVGIGTSSPSDLFDVRAAGAGYSPLLVTALGNVEHRGVVSMASTAGTAFAFFDNTTGANRGKVYIDGTTTINSTASTAGHRVFDVLPLTFPGYSILRVNSADSTSGRVGINTIAPSTALDVVGTVTATLFAGSGASLTSLMAANISGGVLGPTVIASSVAAVTTAATCGSATISCVTTHGADGRITSVSSATIVAPTATALAANGANCSSGQYPLGVDASGNAESCTAAGAGDAVLSSTQTWSGGNRFNSWTIHAGSVTFTSTTTAAFTAPISVSSAAPAIPTANTLYADSAIKARVNFNGTGTPAIRGDFNVSSITDHGAGTWGINFAVAFANTNYTCICQAGEKLGEFGICINDNGGAGGYATGSYSFHNITPADADQDTDWINVICVGEQ